MRVLLVLAFALCVFGQFGGDGDDQVGGNPDGGCCETCGEFFCPLDGKCCKFWISDETEYQGCRCGAVMAELDSMNVNTDALWTDDVETWKTFEDNGMMVCNGITNPNKCETTKLQAEHHTEDEVSNMPPFCYFDEDGTCKNMGSECDVTETPLCGCAPPYVTMNTFNDHGCVTDCSCEDGCPCADEFEYEDGTCSDTCPGTVSVGVYESDYGSYCSLCHADSANCVMCPQFMPECFDGCQNCVFTPQTCTQCSSAICMDEPEYECGTCCGAPPQCEEYEVLNSFMSEPDENGCSCCAYECLNNCMSEVVCGCPPEMSTENEYDENGCITSCSCVDDNENVCDGADKWTCKNTLAETCDWENRDGTDKKCWMSLDLLCDEQMLCGCPPDSEQFEQTDENGCVTDCRCHDPCPEGSEYTLCGSACDPVCGEERSDFCIEMCQEGCFCTEDRFKLMDGEDFSMCVEETACPVDDPCAANTKKKDCKKDVFCKWKKNKEECVTDDTEYQCADHEKKKMCQQVGDGSEFGCEWDKDTKECSAHEVVCQDFHGNKGQCEEMEGCYYQKSKDKCKPE